MLYDKKQLIMNRLVTLHNERSFLAAGAEKHDLKAVSYTNRTMARDLLDIIYDLADGELVDINIKTVIQNNIKYDVVVAEWA